VFGEFIQVSETFGFKIKNVCKTTKTLCFAEPMFWLNSFKNLLWLRNHVVAPLSEEFTFRAAMLPILLQTFDPKTAILITPLFFGVAHLHHMHERIKNGMDKKTVILISSFQFVYTSIFGMYSAYLFVRTGHFIAPFAAHAFCNHMGFPDFQEVYNQTNPKRIILIALYVIGLVSFIVLLPSLTVPVWYSNNLFWLQQL
jgi:prenyl protein peptidase